ncbi:MAG: hypothetical protein IPG05_09825 [Gemmatimonadetes bacterium]|nr:hypothetical protein [Gemmatimonadota bacterium]
MRLVQLLPLLGLLSGCRSAEPPPQQPAERIAAATQLTEMPQLERRAFTLAEADLADDEYGPLAISGEGVVVFRASASDAPMFRIVDSTGRRLHAFGRQGDGPGEFRSPLFMQPRDTSIWIWDARRMVSLLYSFRGDPLGESLAPVVRWPAAWAGDSVDLWVPPGPGTQAAPAVLRTAVRGGPDRTLIPATDSGLRHIVAAWLGQRLDLLPYALGPDRIYIGDSYNFRIYSYDGSGKPLAVFGRQLPPHHRGPREAAEYRASLTRGLQPYVGPDGKAVRQPGISARLDTLDREVTPHFFRAPLHVDDVGRLWVIGTLNDSTTVDVFADTTFLGRTVLPCYLNRRGMPASVTSKWLLLECTLPESSDRPTELQLYRVKEIQRP